MRAIADIHRTGKVFDTAEAAVADIADGSTIAIGGFAGPGTPYNLMRALRDQGARDLTIISNTVGTAHQPRPPDVTTFVESGQAKKVICTFAGANRPTEIIPFTRFHEAGEVEAEVVAMGTLAERLRAAGNGIPAFYTPTGVGTALAEGREVRTIDGRDYLYERALPADIALIRAWKADTAGNLVFRLAQRNFNPLMAMAAKLTIAEVEEPILPAGALDPDQIHCPGLFVHRMIQVPATPEGLWFFRRKERVQ